MTKMTRRKTRRTRTMKTRRPAQKVLRFTTINNGLVAPLIRILNKFT